MPPGIYARRSPAERLWLKVRMDGPVPAHRPELGACWVYTGGSTTYGRMRVDGRNMPPSRVSWFLNRGKWPEFCVLHHCDNPRCVRPSHLFEGTVADNNADMTAKRRNARGARHGTRLHPERIARGERQGHAKLTDKAVEEIRVALSAREPQRSIAKRYGVTQRAIGGIARGETWTHVPTPAEAEAQRRRDEALRPDRERVKSFAASLRKITPPEVRSEDAQNAIRNAMGDLDAIAAELDAFGAEDNEAAA